MNTVQLKTLLKHIILEIQKNEMIANKDYPPDVYGSVNVEEKFENTPKSAISQAQTKVIDVLLQRRFKIVKTIPLKDGQVNVILALPEGVIVKDGNRFANVSPNGRINTNKLDIINFLKTIGLGEQTGTGAVAGYSTPFAFKKTKKKKKLKEIDLVTGGLMAAGAYTVFKAVQNVLYRREAILNKKQIEEDNKPITAEFINSVFEHSRKLENVKPGSEEDGDFNHMRMIIQAFVDQGKLKTKGDFKKLIRLASKEQARRRVQKEGGNFENKLKARLKEKTNPDGTYSDDMEDAIRMKHAEGLSEMTTSSAAGGQAGGTISVPAWGTKNKEGSPRAIKAMKKMGWPVVKSISTEGQ